MRRYNIILHDMMQQLCDKSEDFELNETFFSVKLDEISNKFKQVSDNLRQYLTMQHIAEFQTHSVSSSPIKIFLHSYSGNSIPKWDLGMMWEDLDKFLDF